MKDERRAALAVSIADHQTAIEHFRATGETQYASYTETLLSFLVPLWDPNKRPAEVVAEARNWITDNPELTERVMERSDDDDG